MRNIILVMATMLMVMLAVACGEKDAKSDKDAVHAACTDADRSGDAADLADAVTLTDKEKKEACYSGCLGSDMSKEDCKKACYGDWTKGDKCKTCYEKCVKAGKDEADCKAGCCSDKTKPVDVDVDAGSNPKEDDVGAPDAVDTPGDVTPQG